MPSPAYTRFLASMEMTFDKWHDGEPYDVAAIADMTDDERATLRVILKSRNDWRDIQALARLTPTANNDLFRAFADESNPLITRLEAGEELRELGESIDLVPLILQMLNVAAGVRDNTLNRPGHEPDMAVLSRVFDHIEWNPPADPRIKIHTLRILNAIHTPVATNFASLAYLVFGIAESHYDWTHRPHWLRFQIPEEHDAAMDELLLKISVSRDEINPVQTS